MRGGQPGDVVAHGLAVLVACGSFDERPCAHQRHASVLLANELASALVEDEVEVDVGGGHVASGRIVGEGSLSQHVDVVGGLVGAAAHQVGFGAQQIGLAQAHHAPVVDGGPAEGVVGGKAVPLGAVGRELVERVALGHSEFACAYFAAVLFGIFVGGIVVVDVAADVEVGVADVALGVEAVVDPAAQPQACQSASAQRVAELHGGELVVGGRPDAAVLGCAGVSAGDLAGVFDFVGPDGLGVALRASHVAVDEHVVIVVAVVGQVHAVACADELEAPALDDVGQRADGVGGPAHAQADLAQQLLGHVSVGAALCGGGAHVGQVGGGECEVGHYEVVDLAERCADIVGAGALRGFGHERHSAEERGQVVVGVGAEESGLGRCCRSRVGRERGLAAVEAGYHDVGVVDELVADGPHAAGAVGAGRHLGILVEFGLDALRLCRSGHVGAYLPAAEPSLPVAPAPELAEDVVEPHQRRLHPVGVGERLGRVRRFGRLVEKVVGAGRRGEGGQCD